LYGCGVLALLGFVLGFQCSSFYFLFVSFDSIFLLFFFLFFVIDAIFFIYFILMNFKYCVLRVVFEGYYFF